MNMHPVASLGYILVLLGPFVLATPPDFLDLDCKFKALAFDFAASRIPADQHHRVHDALRFVGCNDTVVPKRPSGSQRTRRTPRRVPPSALSQLFVAVDGDDANAGTIDAPLKSLHRARDLFRSMSPRPATTVISVRKGTYYVSATLELLPLDSGLAIEAYNGEEVTVSGGTRLDGLVWKPLSDGVFVAQLDPSHQTFDQLFYNGERMIRARWPNGNPENDSGMCFSRPQYPGEGCNAYVAADKDTGNFEVPPDVQVSTTEPHRGGVVPGDNHFPTFKGVIYSPYASRQADGPGFSFWNNVYARPKGFSMGANWTSKSWSRPQTGLVHMFHSGLWGGWSFTLASVDAEKRQVAFSAGGWQEARGSGIHGNHFYVENIREELDAPGEWFFDENTRELFFKVNGTTAPPSGLVEVSQLARIITVRGFDDWPVRNVSLVGLHFTHTRMTLMDKYEAPSGGDWTIARQAAVFVDGAEYTTVQACRFLHTGGNGLLLNNRVRSTVVRHCEFGFTGDSAIASVGTPAGVDGSSAAARYPCGSLIANNHMHDVGIYGKQTSCYFQAITCGTSLIDNVCYNGPRAGINFNDGFGGGHHVQGNLIFNMVRETGDHGPFNSWDRQPYVTACECAVPRSVPSLTPHDSIFSNNFIMNGYNGVWTLDNDDGSSYYNHTQNVLVYGGCKNYLGHDLRCGPDNLIVYPGIAERSSGGRQCQTDDSGDFANLQFEGNSCVVDGNGPYTFSNCNIDKHNFPTTHDNSLFTQDGTFDIGCPNALNLTAWQAAGNDARSTVARQPSTDVLIKMARDRLK